MTTLTPSEMTSGSKSNDAGHKPLETLTIEINGNPVPALSSYFVEARPMIPFSTPPQPTKTGQYVLGAKDAWFHKMDIYKNNMLWLLGLSHNRFWSQIVYGTDTWDSVISFLQEGYPFYAADGLPDDEGIITVYYQVYYLVYYVIKRAMTRKESDAYYIGKKYGSLLYNYTIMSVPMMIDICCLYGERFQKETAEMISNVFAAQPLYLKDLDNSVQTVKMAYSSVEQLFTGQSLTPGEVTKLTEGVRPAKRLSLNDLQDSVFYLLDISASLTIFLETFKPAAGIFHNHKFEIHVASLYENIFPAVVQQVQECCDNEQTMSLYFTLMFKLNNARFYFIKLFRLCIQESLPSKSTKQPSPESQTYLDVMTECLACSIFMKDYHSKFPIDHDLDTIAQNCPDFDNIKYNFLLESLMAVFDKATKQEAEDVRPKKSTTEANNSASSSTPLGAPSSSLKPNELSSPVDIHDKILKVKEFLPHLGDGFILKCLEHFDMSPSAALDAILEDTLPPEIMKLDPDLPFIPPEEDVSALPNIYGDDGIEDMCMDFEKRISVHKGKKQGPETDLKQVLDDKSFRKECVAKFSQLGIIESYDDVYDDEYDDSYDNSEPPVPEVEEPDRKFVVPRVLQQGRKVEGGDSDDEEEEEDQPEEVKNDYMNFCENPEDVRARYAAKRLATMRHPPGPKKDVVGNPRGQGQDNSVLRNRQQKSIHKSANRKKAAQYKKSKGLF